MYTKGKYGSASMNLLVVFVLTFNGIADALENAPYVPGPQDQNTVLYETENPQMMFAILARLGQSIIRANDMQNHNKRGLDLGLSRGYSGSLQAKHMMGIAAAGLSGGPGRRRRRRSHDDALPY